jgi:hypothetical protein
MLAVVSSISALARRARALASALHALPAYPVALLLACTLLCVAEAAAVPGPRTVEYAVYLACMLTAFAILAGGAWLLALLALSRSNRVAYVVWPALALGAGIGIAYRVSAFTLLGGTYDGFAKKAIAACVAGGIGLGLVLAAMQPTPRYTRGWLAAQDARWGDGVAALLALAGVGLTIADQKLYVGLYPSAHVALRLCSALVLTLAMISAAPPLPLPKLTTATRASTRPRARSRTTASTTTARSAIACTSRRRRARW